MINLNAKRFEYVCDYASHIEASNNEELQVKLGRVIVHKAEAQWLYEHKNYILTSTSVYNVRYSVNAGYYAERIYHKKGGCFARPGRFYTGDAKFINDVLGFELLNLA